MAVVVLFIHVRCFGVYGGNSAIKD